MPILSHMVICVLGADAPVGSIAGDLSSTVGCTHASYLRRARCHSMHAQQQAKSAGTLPWAISCELRYLYTVIEWPDEVLVRC